MNASARVVQLNSKGVSFMRQNREDKALSSFREAIKILFEHSRQDVWLLPAREMKTPDDEDCPQDSPPQAGSDPPPGRLLSTQGYHKQVLSTMLLESGSQGRENSYHDTPFFEVFNRTFFFSQEVGLSLESQEHHNLASVVVLYNMATANHLKGIKSNGSDHLKTALKLYEMAFDIVMANMNVEITSCCEESVLVIALALSNNIGHIHNVFFNVEQMHICRDVILRLVHESLIEDSPHMAEVHAFFDVAAVFFENGLIATTAPAA